MSETTMSKNYWSQTLKAALLSLVVCTFLILIFALVIKLFAIPVSALSIVNQVIKGLSIIIGCLMVIRHDRGVIKGIMAGLLYVVLCSALFALLGGEFSWTQTGVDFVMCIVLGAVAGLIAANKF